jgi:hypothetical protein
MSTSQPAADRDRDDLGRPRNSRPRDGLGRPLPRGSTTGVERVPDELAMPIDAAIALAQRYLDAGQPFHAHEVLEALWKSRPSSERDLWQGLAQVAVGLTHASRGNAKGALTLLRRGSERIAGYAGDPHGIVVADVLAQVAAMLAHLDGNRGDVRPERLRLTSAT